MSDDQLARIENKIDAFGKKFQGIDSRFDRLEAGLDETRTEMRALHESTSDEIKLIADNVVTLRGEMNHGFAAVRKELADGLAPLSDAIRHHSKILKDHERRIGGVEEP